MSDRFFRVLPLKLAVLSLAAITITACGSSGVGGDQRPDTRLAGRLQRVLDVAIADGLPGAALTVIGEIFRYDGVAGVEEVATAVPLTPNHRFYTASVGKTYTAVLATRLAADGLFDLDDPITRWLPAAITGHIPSSDAITVRRLLNHTSGVFDFNNDGDEWGNQFLFGDPTRHFKNVDVLPYFLDKPLHFEPGTDYRYSDSNYVLAALVLESVTGISIQELVRYYIIDPLGLENTVHGQEALGLSGFVHGYVDYQGETVDVYPLYSHYGLSDGGMQSSAADLAEFVRRAISGNAFFDRAARQELLAPSGIGNPPSSVALGVAVQPGLSPGHVLYFNRGKDVGSRADFLHYQQGDEAITIALCANGSLGPFDTVYESLLQAVLEVLRGEGLLIDF